MENASKALIIAASTLIGIMVLSLMVYTFNRFSHTARETEGRWDKESVDEFNSKFSIYDTGGTYSINDNYSFSYLDVSSRKSATLSYKKLFDKNIGGISAVGYKKALSVASQNLDTIYDVVTCVNDAIDINYRNNNSYLYDFVEIQSSVEVIVDLNGYQNDLAFSSSKGRYLLIEPNKNIKAKCIYDVGDSISESGNNSELKEKRVNDYKSRFNSTYEIKLYDMINKLRENKIIYDDSLNKKFTVYKYYFMCKTFINGDTGLIETIKFTLIKDNKFDEP